MLNKLKQQVKLLKKNLVVLVYAYQDSRTPLLAKLIIGLTVGYLLSPIDLIPDFIPILGLLDDLLIVPLLITLSIRLIPAIVLAAAEQRMIEEPLEKFSKNSWVFAGLIVALWLALFWFLYHKFSYLLA